MNRKNLLESKWSLKSQRHWVDMVHTNAQLLHITCTNQCFLHINNCSLSLSYKVLVSPSSPPPPPQKKSNSHRVSFLAQTGQSIKLVLLLALEPIKQILPSFFYTEFEPPLCEPPLCEPPLWSLPPVLDTWIFLAQKCWQKLTHIP